MSAPSVPVAPKRTTWREAAQVQGNVRRRSYARRGGYSLFVLVCRVNPEVSNVWARLDDPRCEDGVDVSRSWWRSVRPESIAATIVVAKQWAEDEADRLAMLAGAR